MLIALGYGVAWREGGVLAGTALAFILDDAHATVGGVQVAPELQGRGIGKHLLRAVIRGAGRRALILNATLEGAGLYAALGFERCGVVQQWQAAEPARLPRGRTRPGTPADADAIARLDAEAHGIARTTVLQALSQGAVAIAGTDRPTGFAISRRFGRGHLVGPVVAPDRETAIALAAAVQPPGFTRFDVVAGPGSLAATLEAHGFDSVGDVQVMVRGTWPTPPGPARAFGLASQTFG